MAILTEHNCRLVVPGKCTAVAYACVPLLGGQTHTLPTVGTVNSRALPTFGDNSPCPTDTDTEARAFPNLMPTETQIVQKDF